MQLGYVGTQPMGPGTGVPTHVHIQRGDASVDLNCPAALSVEECGMAAMRTLRDLVAR